MQIHSTAVVSPNAQIGSGCRISPFAVIGDEVVGAGPAGHEPDGDETPHLSPLSRLVLPLQDRKFAGGASETEIGRRNRDRSS